MDTETNFLLDSMTPSTAFAKLISMKQEKKGEKMLLNTYEIVCAKEKDANKAIYLSIIRY